jgi:hypothetical protein
MRRASKNASPPIDAGLDQLAGFFAAEQQDDTSHDQGGGDHHGAFAKSKQMLGESVGHQKQDQAAEDHPAAAEGPPGFRVIRAAIDVGAVEGFSKHIAGSLRSYMFRGTGIAAVGPDHGQGGFA